MSCLWGSRTWLGASYKTGLGWGKKGEEFDILDMTGCCFDLFVQIIWSLVHISKISNAGEPYVCLNEQNSWFEELH